MKSQGDIMTKNISLESEAEQKQSIKDKMLKDPV